MPRIDGWEMLKLLKADHRTSEVPVVIVSAHDDYRETLRAARAGAYDYLAKTGRSDAYVASALRAAGFQTRSRYVPVPWSPSGPGGPRVPMPGGQSLTIPASHLSNTIAAARTITAASQRPA